MDFEDSLVSFPISRALKIFHVKNLRGALRIGDVSQDSIRDFCLSVSLKKMLFGTVHK